MREASGRTSYACRNMFSGSHASKCYLLFDSFILEYITKCTITEAHRQPQIRRLLIVLAN